MSVSCGTHLNWTHGFGMSWSVCLRPTDLVLSEKMRVVLVAGNGIQSETSLQSWFNYPMYCIFFSPFSPCPFNGSHERWVRLSLQSKQHISNYINNTFGYLLLKSFTWPAFLSFPELCPTSALIFCFTSRTSVRFPALCLFRPWKSCPSEAHFSLLLRMLTSPVRMLINF